MAHLADFLPVAVMVIDREARILYVNRYAGHLLGRSAIELVGGSAFDLIDERDLDFAVEMLAYAPQNKTMVVGPALLRFVDRDGIPHYTQFRSFDCPGSLGLDGFVLVLTRESTHDLLVGALASVDADEGLETTLTAICHSARGDPLACRAAMIVSAVPGDRSSTSTVSGDWLIPERFVAAAGTPWERSLRTGRSVDVLSDTAAELDDELRAAFRSNGVAAAWVRPVLGPYGQVAAVYVLWREYPGIAGPNQERYIADALQLARLAFDQVLHRCELERAARRDGLTGVANRRAFKERLDHSVRSHDVLYIDLDRFKDANDTYGHEVGDEILTRVAARISEVIRREDVLYRTGGDEFVVICDGIGMGVDEHSRLATRIIERVSAVFACGGHEVHIGATVGIATGTDRSLPDTVRAADAALYTAKDRERGSWHFADHSSNVSDA